MRIGKRRHILIFIRKTGEQRDYIDQLAPDNAQSLAHYNDIRIISDIAARRTEMDDPLCTRALYAVGVNMAHHIMTHLFFARLGYIIIDILCMRLQFGNLRVCNRQSLALFGFCKRNP